MKKMLLAAFFVVPTMLQASVISFQCTSTDFPGIHKFDAHGVVTVDDNDNVEGVATVVTQKAESTQSVQTFEEVRVYGYIRHFRAGEVSKEAFDQVVLKTNEAYLKSLNLLLDFEEKISSRVLSIDNFSYRSNCKTVATFN